MGLPMRVAGMVIVSITSFIEIVIISQNMNVLNWSTSLFLIGMFILYFLLALSSFFGRLVKYVSPAIGMVIVGWRLFTLGMAKIEGTISSLLSTYSGTDVVLSLVVVEIFVFVGFFTMLLGSVKIVRNN